ncbi:MAG: metallophosphoesterase [Synergistaceae bacterium]|jgi:predicted MPP superfamily phosphohydrolase|nr:metallophosphoesterase [Synergistaceae bacterium]
MSVTFFFGLVVTTYALINGYMFTRLFLILRGTGLLRGLACGVFLLFAVSFPASRIAGNLLPPAAANFLFILGSLYLAPMIHGFLLTVAADILRILNYHVTLTSNLPNYTESGRENAVAIIVLLSLALSFAGAVNAVFPTAREFSIRLGGEPHGAPVKIALVSDIHLGRMNARSRLERITNLIKSRNPDIVLIAGDTIDDAAWTRLPARRNEIVSILSSLNPRLGVWAVPGNHDYYSGIENSNAFLRNCGIRVMMDEWAAPGGEFLLIGRDDMTVIRTGKERASLNAIISEARSALGGESARLPVIVLDHQPLNLEEAQRAGAALQLSGHTHKGQLFPANLLVAAIFEKSYGLYKKGETYYYITSGAGTWGPPVRTTGRPEVVFINLE